MKNKLFILFFFIGFALVAQEEDSLEIKTETNTTVVDSTETVEYNALAPSKAAFYSAVLPGLGQAYNKSYWKIPLVYAAIGTSVYFYVRNNEDYNRFRDAYKRRLAGFTDDEFYGDGETPIISNDRLINAQENAQKNKDYSIVFAVLFYALNIVDANVEAHLQQYNINDDLSVEPGIQVDPVFPRTNYGLSFRFNLQ